MGIFSSKPIVYATAPNVDVSGNQQVIGDVEYIIQEQNNRNVKIPKKIMLRKDGNNKPTQVQKNKVKISDATLPTILNTVDPNASNKKVKQIKCIGENNAAIQATTQTPLVNCRKLEITLSQKQQQKQSSAPITPTPTPTQGATKFYKYTYKIKVANQPDKIYMACFESKDANDVDIKNLHGSLQSVTRKNAIEINTMKNQKVYQKFPKFAYFAPLSPVLQDLQKIKKSDKFNDIIPLPEERIHQTNQNKITHIIQKLNVLKANSN